MKLSDVWRLFVYLGVDSAGVLGESLPQICPLRSPNYSSLPEFLDSTYWGMDHLEFEDIFFVPKL